MDPAETADLRRQVIFAGIDAFRAEGHRSVRIDDVARHAGLGLDAVTSLFPSWELLVIAIVDQWSGARRRNDVHIAETDGAVAFLRALLESVTADPALMRTRLALIGAANDVSHPAYGWYRAQYAQFVQDVGLFFTRDVIARREPRGIAPREAAEQLIALYEGLQLQASMLDGTELLPAWDRAATHLRAGWTASGL